MKNIIFASNNPGKVKEVKSLIAGIPINIESLIGRNDLPAIIEDGNTLEENALKKARIIYDSTKSPTISDDTGLEVYHLNMMPGVISARYAGENVTYSDNNQKLLKEMEGVPDEERGAQFRCVAVFTDGKIERSFEGICKGKIIHDLRGTEGFGYDPIFVPDGYRKTYAELTLTEKNKISHRAVAFQKLIKFLIEYYNL
ncbi:MAG: RdgB/HAM1 family non-canonical purine NTP pyrophosphatase [Ignavibacteriales bacterium]|nr:RdgB/HAM1 family non-canonical purine NTP pyrophosphatase [Ignavibacteriales bacterium]